LRLKAKAVREMKEGRPRPQGYEGREAESLKRDETVGL
jgi:hypothetical protein